MARFPEQQLWDRMRRAIPKTTIRLERIENAVSEGIPDVLSLSSGIVTFCELKQVVSAPKRSTTRLIPSGKGLRQSQLNWHLEWNRYGGRSLIIVGLGVNKIYCFPGSAADLVNGMTQDQMAFCSMATNWLQVEEYLRGFR